MCKKAIFKFEKTVDKKTKKKTEMIFLFLKLTRKVIK